MKQNIPLQLSLNFQNLQQRIYYKASVLMSACTSSPLAVIRAASPAVIGKRAIPAYAGFVAVPALTAAQNTTGFAAGVRFPGRPAVAAQPATNGYAAVAAIPELPASPAFAAGVAVPAYPSVPARPAVAEVVPVAAITAITVPAVVAIKGYEDAIDIVASQSGINLSVEFPVAGNVGIVGSNKTIIGEMTPTALQATAWIDTLAGTTPPSVALPLDLTIDTLEQSLYKDMIAAGAVATDKTRNVNGAVINVKELSTAIPAQSGFDPLLDSLQLPLFFSSSGSEYGLG